MSLRIVPSSERVEHGTDISRAAHLALWARFFRPGTERLERMSSTRKLLVATLAVVALFGGVPASASDVEVTLDLSALQPLATVPYQDCVVQVSPDADGIAVLEAAKDASCIDGYETDDFGFGEFVRCIDGICGTDATYWRMTLNGAYTLYGVSDYQASDDDVLGFSYTQWATCLVDGSLC